MLIQIINFIYVLIMQALRLYSFIWFIWIIISWLTAFGAIHLDYYNPIVNFFYRITDGVIDKIFGNFRDKLIIGVIDLSPLVFLLILQMVIPPLITMLYRFVIRLIL
ncbi:YggT family protein [Brachyspira pilosicoli]|uniref:YggT family protein n=1 Tax=Brachyspira pilosicoli TaxID=52584 RepID=UPI001CA4EAE2|nr:YggT family protein [Brachyspira pilosicoli]MBW5396226.1 YggT family protein [Brachyspira pilosicoli]